MADYRSHWNDYGDESNRGSFGYEGEGYMHGGGRDMDDRDWRGGMRDRDMRMSGGRISSRYGDEYSSGGRYGGGRGGYGPDMQHGGESWRDRSRGMQGDFSGGTYGQTHGTERAQQSFRGRGPKNYHRSDERIREDVCERLADDDRVDASEIEVTVHEGIVTLAGSVDDRTAKRRAEDIAESCNGVHDVQNQIRISRERGENRNESGAQR